MPRKIIRQDGDVAYVFNNIKFRERYDALRQTTRRRKVKEEIAGAVNVEVDTVKKWLSGKNGPSDYDIVKQLAEYFEVDEMDFLVKEGNSVMGESTKNFENRELIQSIYGQFVDFIELWSKTHGFFMISYYYEMVIMNIDHIRDIDVQEDINHYYEIASEGMMAFTDLRKAIHKARPFLSADIVSELMSLACDIYDRSENDILMEKTVGLHVNVL